MAKHLSYFRERRAQAIEQRKPVIMAALAKYGVDVEGIPVVEHKNRTKYIHARKHANREERTGKISSFLLRLIYRLTPRAGGFCDLRTGEVHFEKTTGTVTRLHESVHGRDLVQPQIKSMVAAAIEQERSVSIKRPLEYLKFKLEEIRLIAVLEGRAKFCERLASKDSDFTRWERFWFKISRNSEAAVAVVTGYLIASVSVDFLEFSNPIGRALDSICFLLGVWTITKLLPYVLGMRFMEYAEQKTSSPKEALEMTANNPPSLSQLLKPHTYFKDVQ